jgi:WD40 repeat protein
MPSRSIFFVLILLLLFGCSSIEQQRNYAPVKFETVQEINTTFSPDKCLYSFVNKTVFAMHNESSEIHIYQNGKKINTIGGIGFEQINFTKLSDIALAPDGSLLALDSFEKTIKKFDAEGKFIISISLSDFSNPSLVAIASDETFYIYDSDRNEIRTFARMNDYDSYAFGRFELTEPSNLQLAGNTLIVNEQKQNKTLLFSTFGQLEKELEGIFQFEKAQLYQLSRNYIEHNDSQKKYAVSISIWEHFSQQDGYTILTSKDKILIGKFIYEIR